MNGQGQESGPPGHAAHHAPRQLGTIAGRGGWAARAMASLTAVVGTVAGIVPHVLHHVLPLAGAAFLTGATGSVVFGAVGLILTVPLLLRLRRRFQTWWAPAVALALFVVAFSVSTFVIGPAISGDGAADGPDASEESDPHGH